MTEFQERRVNAIELKGAHINSNGTVNENQGNEETVRKYKFSPRYRQFFIGLGPIILQINGGMISGYSIVWTAEINTNKTIDISVEQHKLIKYSVWALLLIGCLLGGFLMEVIGRKYTLMVSCTTSWLGWIIIYFSKDPVVLWVGYALSGLCSGLAGPPSVAYISEIGDPEFRALLIGLMTFALHLGFTIDLQIQEVITWQNIALTSSFLPVISCCIIMWAPDSPTFLAKKLDILKTKHAFYFCRGYGQQSELELQELIKRQNTIRTERKKTLLENLSDLKKPEIFKPMLLILIILMTITWSGALGIPYYLGFTNEIFTTTVYVSTLSSIIFYTKVASSFFACFLLMYVGRRHLVLLSCIGILLSLSTLCLFYFASRFSYVYHFSFLTLIALVIYTAFVNIGLISSSLVIVGEVLPLCLRGLGFSLYFFLSKCSTFLISEISPSMGESWYLYEIFLLHLVCCLIGTILLWKLLPETRNKPFYWIEDYFKGTVPSNYLREEHLVWCCIVMK